MLFRSVSDRHAIRPRPDDRPIPLVDILVDDMPVPLDMDPNLPRKRETRQHRARKLAQPGPEIRDHEAGEKGGGEEHEGNESKLAGCGAVVLLDSRQHCDKQKLET